VQASSGLFMGSTRSVATGVISSKILFSPTLWRATVQGQGGKLGGGDGMWRSHVCLLDQEERRGSCCRRAKSEIRRKRKISRRKRGEASTSNMGMGGEEVNGM